MLSRNTPLVSYLRTVPGLVYLPSPKLSFPHEKAWSRKLEQVKKPHPPTWEAPDASMPIYQTVTDVGFHPENQMETGLKRGSWVVLTKGRYKGDVGVVVDDDHYAVDTSVSALVMFIPRIKFSNSPSSKRPAKATLSVDFRKSPKHWQDFEHTSRLQAWCISDDCTVPSFLPLDLKCFPTHHNYRGNEVLSYTSRDVPKPSRMKHYTDPQYTPWCNSVRTQYPGPNGQPLTLTKIAGKVNKEAKDANPKPVESLRKKQAIPSQIISSQQRLSSGPPVSYSSQPGLFYCGVLVRRFNFEGVDISNPDEISSVARAFVHELGCVGREFRAATYYGSLFLMWKHKPDAEAFVNVFHAPLAPYQNLQIIAT
ncbi:hypothetical protein BDP27DRAFT_1362220 [Rhodocollybia butyracea]|uniref:KOW domain-containing protein n=1 Tax=Rhodocollybia butyracea TaxID=206335 RepID=A0A9P5PZQ4_9AGAR|nr:hypothetical protein BDP27DRAFT_1362220 [Rhodocollybia butyracea]